MTSKKPPDFRPFVSHSHPKVANCQGLDAHQHAAAVLGNPIPRDLIIKRGQSRQRCMKSNGAWMKHVFAGSAVSPKTIRSIIEYRVP